MAALLVSGCSGRRTPTGPDRTPPAPPADLFVAASDESTITLAWTAPGDDGTRGQAAFYDLRYTLDDPPPAWNIASPMPAGLSPPRPAGEAERFTLTVLKRHQVYYFALRAGDAAGNLSEFSNPVRAETGDPASPGQVTDLRGENLLPHGVTLAFTAPGDDGDTGQAVRYGFRRSGEPITEATWAQAESLTLVIVPRPGGEREGVRVVGLEPERTCHFAVRAWDDAGKAGPISNDLAVTPPADTVAPSGVADLAAVMDLPFRATLSWTAPGNDGEESRAAGYEIRWAREPVTEAGWDTAAVLGNPPAPGEPGTRETYEARLLPGNAQVWFAVRGVDEAGNRGPVSNGATGMVMGSRRTWRVNVGGTGDAPTVQAAIDSAILGDVVLVEPGRYYENIDFMGKDITVRSAGGPEATILDGSTRDSSVVVFRRGETRAAVLEGFTITGGSGVRQGSAPTHDGGGIYCIYSDPVIRNNFILRNVVPGYAAGGGMLARASNALVEGNLFEGNESEGNGGGLALREGVFEVRGNVFKGNRCVGDGGGLWFWQISGELALEGNEFWENVAGDHGGGAYVSPRAISGPCFIRRNLFVRNTVSGEDHRGDTGSGAAIAALGMRGSIDHNTMVENLVRPVGECGGGGTLLYLTGPGLVFASNVIVGNSGCGIACWDGTASMRLNLLWSNQPGDIGTGLGECPSEWADSLVVADPLFCDPANDDYHVALNSPAIIGKEVMGAYEQPGCGSEILSAAGFRKLFKAGTRD